MKKHFTYLIVFFLLQGFLVAQENQSNQEEPKQPVEVTQRFIDLDGDGFNDNAPDIDQDGIPDALDPDIKQKKSNYRWAWYRAIPDSAKSDSSQFQSWWTASNRPVKWQVAWGHWQGIVETFGPDGPPCRRDKDGFYPGDGRFRRDPRQRGRSGGSQGGNGRGQGNN